jgi:hypothetical protein
MTIIILVEGYNAAVVKPPLLLPMMVMMTRETTLY